MTHECCDSGVRKSARDIIVRELVSNLLIHREFVSPFPAKLIIDSGGIRAENASRALYEGRITLSDFNPMPKKPTIADAYAHIGRAEELGSGIGERLPSSATGSRPLLATRTWVSRGMVTI